MYRRARAKSSYRRKPGEMNKTELAYSEYLDDLVERGEILGYLFEPIKLRLAPLTYLTPDFLVVSLDGTLDFHEVKACMSDGRFLCEDDAKVKIKVAAEMYPMFGFVLCGKLSKKTGGGWRFEQVGTTPSLPPHDRGASDSAIVAGA